LYIKVKVASVGTKGTRNLIGPNPIRLGAGEGYYKGSLAPITS